MSTMYVLAVFPQAIASGDRGGGGGGGKVMLSPLKVVVCRKISMVIVLNFYSLYVAKACRSLECRYELPEILRMKM